MKPEDMNDAIGRTDETSAEEAALYREQMLEEPVGWKRKTIRWILAACAFAAILLLFLWPEKDALFLSAEKGCTYRDYYGPVFPLSMAEKNENILASRQIDYDFSYYEKKNNIFSSDQPLPFASVTDSYRLKNSAAEAQTVTLCYPFNTALIEKAPTFLLNGEKAAAGFHLGLEPTLSNALAWNLLYKDEWNRKLYAATAELGIMGANISMDETEAYLNLPVTVYRINDVRPEQKKAGLDSFMLSLEYPEPDPQKTIILSFGLGISASGKDGMVKRGFFIYKGTQYGPDHYLIVIGEDIASYELKAYENGSMQQESDRVSGTVTRYKASLREILEETAFDYWAVLAEEQLKESPRSLEETLYAQIPRETLLSWLVCQMVKDRLFIYGGGSLSQTGELKGELRSLCSSILLLERIVFAEFTVSVRAGEAFAFSAVLEKKGSSVSGNDEKAVKREDITRSYDMLTKSGSLLRFEEQTASISHYASITITDQNFGFDLQNGITEVALDPNTEYYYMNVKRKK